MYIEATTMPDNVENNEVSHEHQDLSKSPLDGSNGNVPTPSHHRPLPPGWSEHYDENYKTHYYVHEESGHTQWDFPTINALDVSVAMSPHNEAHNNAAMQASPGYSLPTDMPDASHLNGVGADSSDPTDYSVNSVVTEPLGASRRGPNRDRSQQPQKSDGSSPARRVSVQWLTPDEMLLEGVSMRPIPLPYEEGDEDGACSIRVFQGSSSQKYEWREEEDDHFDNDEDRVDYPARRRNKSLVPGGSNQDYLALARTYRLQRPYSDPKYHALCVLCYEEYAQDVFFPCEHHCVCRKCILKEKICEDRMLPKLPDGYVNCSLCAAIIKRILPLEDGKEVEKYWQWVLEERVELSKSFLRDFKHSEAVIKTVYYNDQHRLVRSDSNQTSFCVIS